MWEALNCSAPHPGSWLYIEKGSAAGAGMQELPESSSHCFGSSFLENSDVDWLTFTHLAI